MNDIIPWEQIKYKNVKKIGEGVFSVVYKADGNVVIKMQKYGKENKEVFMDELKIYSKLLKSDNYSDCVIKPLDNFKTLYNDTVRICIVFEKMTCDLLKFKKILKKNKLPLHRYKIIIKQILQGLKFLHENEIIHTDIKPENILINSELKVKIIDLGNSCYFNKHFSDSISTSEYRSPEAILQGNYNEKSDIWSTACLIYELLTGDYLFDSWKYFEDSDSDTESNESDSDPESNEDESEDESESDPESNEDESEDENDENDIQHFHLMETYLGKFPKKLVKGKNAKLYFDSYNDLKEPYYRLGNAKISECIGAEYNFSKEEAKEIEEFLLPMLIYDPEERASAEQMLNHKFLMF